MTRTCVTPRDSNRSRVGPVTTAFGSTAAKLREYLTSRRGRSYLRMTIRNRKLVDTLVDRALGTDASAGEPATEEPPTAEDTEQQPEESA